MSETLMDRAYSNLSAAKVNFSHRSDDYFFLNLTGYLLQQTVELALKHLLETNAIKYPRTHDISELVCMLPKKYDNLTNNLLMMAGTITSWESKTRYIKDYFLEERQIKLGFSVVEDFLNSVDDSNSVRKLNLT